MRDGVFFRLAGELPQAQIEAWEAANLRDPSEKITAELAAHEGGTLLGGEISVAAKILKAALANVVALGIEITRRDVSGWSKLVIDGQAHIRLETRGALARDASVADLLALLRRRAAAGLAFVTIEDGRHGRIDLWGYLAGHDGYSDHLLPLLLAGAAAGRLGGRAELVCVGDTDLRDEPVLLRRRCDAEGVEVEEWDPQDVDEALGEAIDAGLGERGYAGIHAAHYLFAGSDTGGERAAIAYTILRCCRLADVEPVEYLTDVLSVLSRGIRRVDVPKLMPASWAAARRG